MDRISRALEQAKSKIADKADEEQIITARKPVRYTKSKKIQLDKKLLQQNRILTEMEDGRIIDTYGLLRTRVLQLMRQNNWKTLGITSPNPSTGKTLTAINLAISIALDHNYSALLIDADLRKPGVNRTLGLESMSGLDDYLMADEAIENIFVSPEIENLLILPTNEVHKGSAELLSSPGMIRFIEQAKKRYPERIVLFDLPPVLIGDDVVALSTHLDAMLIVVEDGATGADDFVQAVELLQNVNVIGTVLNKALVAENQTDYYY